MSVRRLRDSSTFADIPLAGTDIVAVYRTGHVGVATPAQVKARFGDIPVCWIDVLGTDPTCDVLDVEPGDADVTTAVGWVKAKLALKPSYPPIIYCDRSHLTPLFNAMNAAGLQIATHFRLWIATLDGTTKTVPDMTGVTAVQWAGQAHTGGHWDDSIVYDAAWKAGGPVSATGPEHWDAADWAAYDAHATTLPYRDAIGVPLLWWLTHGLAGNVTPEMDQGQANAVSGFHDALAALFPAPPAT